MLASFFTAENLIALFTLALLEIVLGIDNLVFIAILTGRLPREQQKMARQLGLAAALITRLMLLASLSWIASLTNPLFEISFLKIHGEPYHATGKALILFGGGLFLMYKAVSEIYHKVELHDEGVRETTGTVSLAPVILNIALMDIIFSLDSVITAVGLANHLGVMIAAVVIAMIVMIVFADSVANFINEYASLKILALAFLLMIGMLLTAESLEFTIPKAFVYFAMFFSLGVELIQIRYEVNLKRRLAEESAAE